MLLRRGADVWRENWYGTALHCTAESGEKETMLEFLDTGLDVDIRASGGRTSLHGAIVSGHIGAIQILCKRGADVEAMCDQGLTPLQYAIFCEHPTVLIKALLTYKANVEALSKDMRSLLHDAAEVDGEEILLFFLDQGLDVHAEAAHGFTPLHVAAARDRVENVRILLEYGAHVDALAHDGDTALHVAAVWGCRTDCEDTFG